MFTVSSILFSVAHWIFATQYIEVMLLLPLLLEHRQENIPSKQRRIVWILKSLNAYFFVQVAAWAYFMIAYSDFEDFEILFKVISFDPANKLLPAIVLVISVLLFRCRFNSKKSQKVVANEKVIVFHVILFLSYVITYSS